MAKNLKTGDHNDDGHADNGKGNGKDTATDSVVTDQDVIDARYELGLNADANLDVDGDGEITAADLAALADAKESGILRANGHILTPVEVETLTAKLTNVTDKLATLDDDVLAAGVTAGDARAAADEVAAADPNAYATEQAAAGAVDGLADGNEFVAQAQDALTAQNFGALADLVDNASASYDSVVEFVANVDNYFTATVETANEFRTIEVAGTDANDFIVTNSGNDTIFAGSGNDVIFGNAGDDFIQVGNTGVGEFIDGNVAGNDVVFGGAGNDTIIGDAGSDTIDGGSGNDVIAAGGTATEVVNNDTINGGSGNDVMAGGYGNDTLFGGAGNDYVEGNNGNDILNGGTGNDTMLGGSGNDIFVHKYVGDSDGFGNAVAGFADLFEDGDQYLGGTGEDTLQLVFEDQASYDVFENAGGVQSIVDTINSIASADTALHSLDSVDISISSVEHFDVVIADADPVSMV